MSNSIVKEDITVVVPLRITEDTQHMFSRVDIFGAIRDIGVSVLLVDYGSSTPFAKDIQAKCTALNIDYAYADSACDLFDLGAARNHGAQLAKTDYIASMDIDLVADCSFFDKLVSLANYNDMGNRHYRFMTYSCLYMSEELTKEFDLIADAPEEWSIFFTKVKANYFQKNNSAQKTWPLALSGGLFVRRERYLSMGGMSSVFMGHGGEDFDLLFRMQSQESEIPYSKNIDTIYKSWEGISYVGLRAYLSIKGLRSFYNDIIVYHRHHGPIKNWSNPEFRSIKPDAWSVLKDEMDAFLKTGNNPAPLANLAHTKNILIFAQPNSNFCELLRDFLPYIGNCVIAEECAFPTVDHITAFCASRGIKTVIFPNSAGNEHRHALFQKLKSQLDVKTFERGALPGSWYFDDNFALDSESYDAEIWDHPLMPQEQEDVRERIMLLRSGLSTLENNEHRIGVEKTQKSLRLDECQRVLFIPLQTPGDCVMHKRYERTCGYQEFLGLHLYEISRWAQENGWKIIIKRHPLYRNDLFPPEITVAQDYHNIHDLIDVADAVLCYNSGVGLLSLAHFKKTICIGKSFYVHEGLAEYADGAAGVISLLQDGKEPCRESVLRFLHYLYFRFYSFVESKTTLKKVGPNNYRNETTSLEFSQCIFDGKISKKNLQREQCNINEMAFMRYKDATENTYFPPVASPPGPSFKEKETIPFALDKIKTDIFVVDLLKGFYRKGSSDNNIFWWWCGQEVSAIRITTVKSDVPLPPTIFMTLDMGVAGTQNVLQIEHLGQNFSWSVAMHKGRVQLSLNNVEPGRPIMIICPSSRLPKNDKDTRIFYYKVLEIKAESS